MQLLGIGARHLCRFTGRFSQRDRGQADVSGGASNSGRNTPALRVRSHQLQSPATASFRLGILSRGIVFARPRRNCLRATRSLKSHYPTWLQPGHHHGDRRRTSMQANGWPDHVPANSPTAATPIPFQPRITNSISRSTRNQPLSPALRTAHGLVSPSTAFPLNRAPPNFGMASGSGITKPSQVSSTSAWMPITRTSNPPALIITTACLSA